MRVLTIVGSFIFCGLIIFKIISPINIRNTPPNLITTSLFRANKLPTCAEIIPKITKTETNPITNIIAFEIMCFLSGTLFFNPIPVIYAIYVGTIGNKHDAKKVTIPALNAIAKSITLILTWVYHSNVNIFLVIAVVLIVSLYLGKFLEKFRVPWIFAALLVGSILAIKNPVSEITSSETFSMFSRLGMYLLLFLVGFELDINQIKTNSKFIFRSTFFIICTEGLVGSLLVHYIFHYSWVISLLVSMSFATVGEAILIPILHEFGLVNTKLGQAIIGIGTADDVIEVLLLLIASVIIGTKTAGNPFYVLLSLGGLVLLTVVFRLFGKKREQFKFASIETLFLFILFIFFLFIGVGVYAQAEPLAAVFAGISIKLFIPQERLEFVDSELKSLTYGLFAPLFFVSIGSELDIKYLISAPLLVLLVVVVSNITKIITSYIAGHNFLGKKESILLGIGLSVRFSTSIIIIKFLFDNGVVGFDIYSVVIASSIVFKFIIPLLFSELAVRWKISK